MKFAKPVIGLSRDEMAQRVAMDIPNGSYVNLGIGIPELITQFVPDGREFIYHTENGLLGMGPSPEEGVGDPELINAGKRQVTALPGSSYFQHPDSFAMIRGGHLDLCVLGALQVASNGDLANWSTGGPDAIPAVGGAMDLVASDSRVVVTMDHCAKNGSQKILETCNLPLTGKGVVDLIITDLAVFEVEKDVSSGKGHLVLVEKIDDVSLDELVQKTGCRFQVSPKLKSYDV